MAGGCSPNRVSYNPSHQCNRNPKVGTMPAASLYPSENSPEEEEMHYCVFLCVFIKQRRASIFILEKVGHLSMHKENEKSLAILQCRNNQTLRISSFKIFSYMYMWRKQEREHFKIKEMVTCSLFSNQFFFLLDKVLFKIKAMSYMLLCFQSKARHWHVVSPEWYL